MTRRTMLGLVLVAGIVRADVLTTDKPVYRAGVSGPVKITITNDIPLTVYLPNSAPWKVLQGNTLVYKPAAKMMSSPLGPGKSKTYEWNKKGITGKFVPRGSYTIVFGPVESDGGEALTLSRTIALTKGGTLAGDGYFPLSKFNTWVYQVAGGTEQKKMAIVDHDGSQWYSGGWWKVQYLIGAEFWIKMVQTPYPTLVEMGDEGTTDDLFRFKRPVGHTYDLPWAADQARVAAHNVTVQTPAGTFTGCTRIDFIMFGDPGEEEIVNSFWFSPGTGLVQYKDQVKLFALRKATLRGMDKKFYTIGLTQ